MRSCSRSAGRHVGERRVPAELQRADVGDDRPAILRPDLGGVVGHRAEAVRDHVEEVSDRRLAQPVLVKRRRPPIAALHDHAVALAGAAVARRAEDVEALLSARHHASRRPGTETPSRPRRSPCPCTAARRLAAGRARPCRRRAAAPSGRRRRTSTRAAACTSADRACPGGSAARRSRNDARTLDRGARKSNAGSDARALAASAVLVTTLSPQRSSPPADSSVSRNRRVVSEVELRIARLDAQEEPVAAGQREARHVEHRVIRLRQAVQRQHAEAPPRAPRRGSCTRRSPG